MRREDWPERLAEYVESARAQPFAWGTHDCATFAAGAVEAVTGTRPQIPVVTSAQAFSHLVRDHGDLEHMTSDQMGPSAAPASARRGDLVLVALDGRQCLAVCLGASAAAPGESGLVMVPMHAAIAAWAV